MSHATEVTVIVKNPEASYRQKFMVYENYTVTPEDPILKQCIDETLSNSKIEPEDIDVKIHMTVQ